MDTKKLVQTVKCYVRMPTEGYARGMERAKHEMESVPGRPLR